MNIKTKEDEGHWGRPKSGQVCNIFGDVVTTTSYWAGNSFKTNLNVRWIWITTQEEKKELGQLEEKQNQIAKRCQKELIDIVIEAAAKHCTVIQYRAVIGYLDGIGCTQMAREFGCTAGAVYQALWGIRGQGGAIRKLRKVLLRANRPRP